MGRTTGRTNVFAVHWHMQAVSFLYYHDRACCHFVVCFLKNERTIKVDSATSFRVLHQYEIWLHIILCFDFVVKEFYCPLPGQPDHGKVTPTGQTVEDHATIACYKGYATTAAENTYVLQCRKGSTDVGAWKWIGSKPECLRTLSFRIFLFRFCVFTPA